MNLAVSALTRIASWLIASVCYGSMRKSWKPLFNQPRERNMKGLETLLNDEHMTEDEMGLHNEQLHNDLSLLRHQQAHPTDTGAVSADWCEDCGIEIPEARRKAVPGVQLCVDCQGEVERKDRTYR